MAVGFPQGKAVLQNPSDSKEGTLPSWFGYMFSHSFTGRKSEWKLDEPTRGFLFGGKWSKPELNHAFAFVDAKLSLTFPEFMLTCFSLFGSGKAILEWQAQVFSTYCHRCPFWLFWLKDGWRWFTWCFNHYQGHLFPRIYFP